MALVVFFMFFVFPRLLLHSCAFVFSAFFFTSVAFTLSAFCYAAAALFLFVRQVLLYSGYTVFVLPLAFFLAPTHRAFSYPLLQHGSCNDHGQRVDPAAC